MARNVSNLPAVGPFSVDESSNVSKKWEDWKEDFEIYLSATGVSQDTQKKALMLHLAGKDVKDIYKTLKANNTEQYEEVCTKLDRYFKPRKNITYERYIFREAKQRKNENTVSYITRLRSLSDSCNFNDTSEAVKDHFICSCYSLNLKRKLLIEKDITLEKVIEIGRYFELAKEQADNMKTEANASLEDQHVVNQVKKNKSNQHFSKNLDRPSYPNRKSYNGETKVVLSMWRKLQPRTQ